MSLNGRSGEETLALKICYDYKMNEPNWSRAAMINHAIVWYNFF
jgi:hypothetical protein